MKTNIKARVTGAAAAVIIATTAAVPCARAEEDINQIFQMGRAAYYQGNIELARQLLSQVAAKNPKHFETQALLAQIKTMGSPEGVSLRKKYESVMIPKVEFQDVTLGEAVQALGVMSKNASGGKVVPNFIVKDAEVAAKKVSLSLSNVPLTEVINYLTQITGTRATYDKHAVIFSGLGG